MHEALKVTWKSWLIRLLQLSDTWFFFAPISSVDTLPCQDRSSSRVKGLTSSARLRMPLDSSAYPREMLRCQRLERTADALKMLRSLRPPSMGSKILRLKPTCRGVGWRSALTVTLRRTVGLQVWIFLALFVYVCVYLSLKYYHSKYAMCVNVACYLKQYQTDSGYTKVLCFSCTQSHKKKCRNGSEWFTHQWTNDICILILKKKPPWRK